ncbi:MAG: hypothetical protein QMD01_08130, partial [Thermodesulfovibrionales bacterium]|nr:hypothetical protein [Thermodesulfovibrionales bacterium]
NSNRGPLPTSTTQRDMLAVGIAIVTYYIVIASTEVHKIVSQKAWLVFGIIGAVFALMGISGEFAARKAMREMPKFQKDMEDAAKMMQKQAEEMQKRMRQ